MSDRSVGAGHGICTFVYTATSQKMQQTKWQRIVLVQSNKAVWRLIHGDFQADPHAQAESHSFSKPRAANSSNIEPDKLSMAEPEKLLMAEPDELSMPEPDELSMPEPDALSMNKSYV